jgi:lysophospholipase L1-like esterase
MKKHFIVFTLFISILHVSFAQVAKTSSLYAEKEKLEAKIAQNERMLKDWPNLARYRDDNAKIGLPAAGIKRVVFMGNSITEGWKNADSLFFKNNPYLCRGISGQTTPQMLVRFRQDVINLKPALVVILAGINDIAGNTGPSTLEMIEDNLSSMADIARSNGIKVVMCSVLPAYDFPWRPGLQPAEKVISLNKWIKEYSENHGCGYVDYFSPMADERNGLKASLSSDGVHPNLDGYKIMEPLVEKAIQAELK